MADSKLNVDNSAQTQILHARLAEINIELEKARAHIAEVKTTIDQTREIDQVPVTYFLDCLPSELVKEEEPAVAPCPDSASVLVARERPDVGIDLS